MSEIVTLQVAISTSSGTGTKEAVVNQSQGKKKEKRKRLEGSSQVLSGPEELPAKKRSGPPTGPRKQRNFPPPRSVPLTTPTGTSNSTPPSSFGASPAAVATPPRHPRKFKQKATLPRTSHVHQSAPTASPVSQMKHPLPSAPNSPGISPYLAKVPPSYSPYLRANKDRVIHELRQKLAHKEADLTYAYNKMSGMREQIKQAGGGVNSDSSLEEGEIKLGSVQEEGAGNEVGGWSGLKQAEGSWKVPGDALSRVQGEKAALEARVSMIQREGQATATRLAEAENKCKVATNQARAATEKGKKSAQKVEELEAELALAKAEAKAQGDRAADMADQLELLMADSTIDNTATLRQTLLNAKMALAKERLASHQLRNELAASSSTLAERDLTITSLTTTLEQKKAEIALSSSRVAELSQESDLQLSYLKDQVETVRKSTSHITNLQSERDTLRERNIGLSNDLAAASHRAEWYKLEFKRRDGDARKAQAEAMQKRKDAERWRYKAGKATGAINSFVPLVHRPAWGAVTGKKKKMYYQERVALSGGVGKPNIAEQGVRVGSEDQVSSVSMKGTGTSLSEASALAGIEVEELLPSE
ncbi:uncharacterized protein MKK02DRAFT_29754 [Dioszegia hungarica]|uniref:Uncharacterized protein n=1 Tax=Dioszegia hungarica TaxID=4972 RepID=A0AA38HGK4_9TREE|nr:uncharacterized protein MKK02DRAFT_29754 [Dioszegia hungarica]KAI9639771.1 hypothetical protein MKK02DRAFT_29754 [Dioszegia hungarica]